MEEQACMNCKKIHKRNNLQWIRFPWKKICEDCYDKIREVCGNISMKIH